jgi:hypothetical protein
MLPVVSRFALNHRLPSGTPPAFGLTISKDGGGRNARESFRQWRATSARPQTHAAEATSPEYGSAKLLG